MARRVDAIIPRQPADLNPREECRIESSQQADDFDAVRTSTDDNMITAGGSRDPQNAMVDHSRNSGSLVAEEAGQIKRITAYVIETGDDDAPIRLDETASPTSSLTSPLARP